MSPHEIWWRLTTRIGDAVDRCAPRGARRQMISGPIRLPERPELLCADYRSWEHPALWPQWPAWSQAARTAADRLAQGQLAIFDLQDAYPAGQIDWNYEPKARRKAPLSHAPGIDYREYRLVGDCKFVWEPNRHHHLVVLARAWRLTGDLGYAEALAGQLASWLGQCPFPRGMNWRSPLELGIRLINWVWALELARPAGVIDEELARAVCTAAYRHLHEITRRYSRFSSANNHLIGEAAGVFIGATFFEMFRESAAWRREAHDILCHEIFRQTYADGGTREQAMGYHLFVLEFFMLCGLVGRRSGQEFPQAWWERLERMCEFVAGFAEGGPLPMFGDCDDGYVLNLGGQEDRTAALLGTAAVLFQRADFKALAGEFGERTFWLTGGRGREVYDRLSASPLPSISSRSFPESGYYLLQASARDGFHAISLTFDCGELGFGPIAAHGHADALSFTLRVGGRDILVDPGTYDYFTFPVWRRYFRSTRAHNTVVVDGTDQSEMLGPFLWGKRAACRLLEARLEGQGGLVAAHHDGYTSPAGGILHHRTISLDAETGRVVMIDRLEGHGAHEAELTLHIAEGCTVTRVGERVFRLTCGEVEIGLEFDGPMHVEELRACDNPPGGWVARGYHRKSPSTTLVGRCRWAEHVELVTRLTPAPESEGLHCP